METFSALLAICVGNSPVTGEFPTQRPVTRSFDGFFDLCMNKRWSKQWWGWWFKTPSRPLWRHCNDYEIWSTFKRIHSSFTHVGHFYVLHTVKVLGIIQCIYGLQSVNMYFELKKKPNISSIISFPIDTSFILITLRWICKICENGACVFSTEYIFPFTFILDYFSQNYRDVSSWKYSPF